MSLFLSTHSFHPAELQEFLLQHLEDLPQGNGKRWLGSVLSSGKAGALEREGRMAGSQGILVQVLDECSSSALPSITSSLQCLLPYFH